MSTSRVAGPREELANAITHGAGFVASLIGLPFLVLSAANRGERAALVGASVFGAALVALYAASTLYHAVSHPTLKQKMRVLDHAAIYLLIAGTYTPFTLGVLRGRWGWALFGIVWTLAALGVLFKVLFGSGAMAKLSTIVYVAMGWVAIFAAKPLIANMESAGLILLVGGGLFYTGGVVFYVDKRRSWTHPVWHLFVLGGSLCHYFAVLFYSAPAAALTR
ncbi:PAQR family membrane homeostasis protein TrhA [Gemmatimonas sp.]|jgi:hemolysin III|uniref:PAQR family membrane homeostasis protein TrhA n=1 Tax=Gemmatimonas sp. TaxID=1962908 RepID=UPI0037BE3FA8